MADTNKTKAAPSPEELLIQKDAEITALKAENEAQTAAIQKKEELYSASAEELEALRKEVNELRAAAKAEAKPAKVVPGVKFEFEGSNYKFKDTAPKSIRIDGVAKSQKDIAADEEILLQLVASNSGLIEKIYE